MHDPGQADDLDLSLHVGVCRTVTSAASCARSGSAISAIRHTARRSGVCTAVTRTDTCAAAGREVWRCCRGDV